MSNSLPDALERDVPTRAERAEQTRNRILDEAMRLFAHHGFAATPVRRIADRAGVASGLIHYHFENKEGLLHSVFERSLDQVGASLDEALAAASHGPVEGLERLVRTAFATVARNQDFWRLNYQLRMQPAASEALGGALADWTELVRGRLELLLRRVEHPDPEPASRALFAAVDGAAQHFVLDPDGYPLDQVARAIVDAFVPSDASAARCDGRLLTKREGS